jgi:hypothetical protein
MGLPPTASFNSVRRLKARKARSLWRRIGASVNVAVVPTATIQIEGRPVLPLIRTVRCKLIYFCDRQFFKP